jgi:hypothetical protein
MATSKTQQKAVQKYVATHYDRIVLTMPAGQRDIIKARAEKLNESVNAYINRLISEDLIRDEP